MIYRFIINDTASKLIRDTSVNNNALLPIASFADYGGCYENIVNIDRQSYNTFTWEENKFVDNTKYNDNIVYVDDEVVLS